MNHNIIDSDNCQVLVDYNRKTNKVSPWREKKKNSLLISESFQRLNELWKARFLESCGEVLSFVRLEDGSLKLKSAQFCKNRLCPMCAWRRSLKIFGQVSKIMDYFGDSYRYLFLTLTIKNVHFDDLSNTIDEMMKGFKLLMQSKRVKKSVRGAFRGLEVTFNHYDGSFHPHFHIILAVDPDYFSNPRKYIAKDDFVSLWRRSMRLDYDPIIDIRKIKNSVSKAVAEVAKYTVKDKDYVIESDPWLQDKLVQAFSVVLHGRRLISFTGVFREAHRFLNLDDALDGDLIHTDGEDLRDDLQQTILIYRWNFGLGNYYLNYSVDI